MRGWSRVRFLVDAQCPLQAKDLNYTSSLTFQVYNLLRFDTVGPQSKKIIKVVLAVYYFKSFGTQTKDI